MSKKWIPFANNSIETGDSKRDIIKKERNFAKAIRGMKVPKKEELIDEGKILLDKRQAYEDSLLAAAENGILKSEKLLKEVEEIKIARAKAEKKQQKKKEKAE